MIKKRGLGKGLNALLGDVKITNIENTQNIPNPNYQELAINKIIPGVSQPRKNMPQAELQQLADSIKSQGVLQPIIVREQGKKFEIIAGERRWRAAQLAGLTIIPVVIKNVDDKIAAAIALVENLQRQDLNPLEEAQALDKLSNEFNLTHNEVATAVGKSRAAVSNYLRLLTLEPEVKLLLAEGKIEAGHAKVLLAVKGLEQCRLANNVVRDGLSVRATENLVNNKNKKFTPATISNNKIDPDVARLQRSLAEGLGAKVVLNHNSSGKGKIIIDYSSLDQLEGILEKFEVINT